MYIETTPELVKAVNAVNAAYLDNSAADTYDCLLERYCASFGFDGDANWFEDYCTSVREFGWGRE